MHTSPNLKLDGKAAMITGGGSGIGRASAIKYCREGCDVLILDLHEDALKKTCDLAKEEECKGKIEYRVCNVTSEEQIKENVDLTCKLYGKIDIVFANAGIVDASLFFADSDADDFRRVFDVNVIGVFNCLKYGSLKMRQQGNGGALIATASVAGIKSGAGSTVYSASKAAVISLVETVANQLYGTNIRCNCICPGLIETGMTKTLFDYARAKGSEKKIGQLNPLARYGHPEEIANVASFLASDEASYVNGIAVPVCGGLTSSLPVALRKAGRASM